MYWIEDVYYFAGAPVGQKAPWISSWKIENVQMKKIERDE